MNLEGLIREREYDKPVECSKCGGKLKYIGIGEYECTQCGNKELDDYGKVRNFLEEHPGANVLQTEKGTGVSKSVINDLIVDGKLEISSKARFLRGDGEE